MPPSRHRPAFVQCTCQSHCMIFNPETGLYEGDGQMIPPSTRTNHRKDDKRNFLFPTPPLSPPPPQLAPTHPLETPPDSSLISSMVSVWTEEVDVLSQRPLTSRRGLDFVGIPSAPFNPALHTSGTNLGLYALKSSKANYFLLYVETRLCELQSEVSAFPHHTDEVAGILDQISTIQRQIIEEKALYWNLLLPLSTPGISRAFNTSIHFFLSGPSNPTLRAVYLSTLVLEHFFFTPRRALRTHLASLKGLLRGKVDDFILRSIPVDPRTCAVHYRLNPIVDPYICCPSCFFLYPDQPDVSQLTLPHCTHKKTPGSEICSSALWKGVNITGRGSHFVPITRYYHQDLKFWVGKLLSRPGIEALLLRQAPPVSNRVTDIWQSSVFAELRDSSGNHFLPGPSTEGRLVFSLAVDSFNPFWNKTAKQSVSSTCIWLVLLNLPPHLRYLPENIFLAGVIPGKPSTDEINHAIQLLVNVLLEFWNPGVFFSRTYEHPSGWLYLAMLVPLIADMLAARQVIGLPGTTMAHYCCTFCEIDIDDIGVFEPSIWPAKDIGHIRNIASKYKAAQNEKEQNDLFDAYGIRWTPLLDLPYWDPIRFTVIDSMHALDLNLIQNHCRKFFQIDTTSNGGMGRMIVGSPVEKRAVSQKDQRVVASCLDTIREYQPDLREKLLGVHRKILYTICVDYQIDPNSLGIVVGTKQVLANRLLQWRARNRNVDPAELFPPLTSLTADPPQDATPLVADNTTSQSISTVTSTSETSTVSIAGDDATRPVRRGGRRVKPSQVARVIRHLLANNRDKALSDSTANVLIVICNGINLDISGFDLSWHRLRSQLFEHLTRHMDHDAGIARRLEEFGATTAGEKRPLLGKDVMEAIWGDMKNTQTPTWIDPAPPDWGTPRRGKLSADHWRVIGTIHLPITLIRLWRVTDPRYKFITHYMHLINAIRLANLKSTTPAQIGGYKAYILTYLRELQTLYPDVKLRPTHHAAYHIYDMLKQFGPVHSHSAPFFERYNNFLQRMNTNRKIGQVESTFMHTSGRHSNLKAILQDSGPIRDSVVEMVTSLDAIQSEDSRGLRLASMLDPTLPTNILATRSGQHCLLSEDEYLLLLDALGTNMPDNAQAGRLPTDCKSFAKLSVNSICYGVAETPSYRDSTVIFRPNQLPNSNSTPTELAGSIRRLFEYSYILEGREKRGYFVSIMEHRRTTESRAADPYPAFGYAAGYLCERSDDRLHVIELSQLVSHFVLTRFPEGEWAEYIHVLPVDRLMLSFRFEETDLPADEQQSSL